MAKNSYLSPGANVETTDTFATWMSTTNDLIYDMGTIVVTTTPNIQPNTSNGGVTSGNAHIQGTLSATTLTATSGLRGGTVSVPANLVITSNTMFNQSPLVQIGANTNNFNIAAANTTYSGSRLDIDTALMHVTAQTIFETASVTIDANTISLGLSSTQALNVFANADFNSNVNIDGTLNVTANSTFNGGQTYIQSTNTIIGNSTTDRLNVTAYLSSDLLPASNSVDLGTDSLPYGNVHTTYVWADNNVESLGELVLKGTATKTIRTTGSDGTYKSLNLTFSNNSVSNTAVVANTSGLFGGYTQLYSLGSAAVNWKELYVQNSFVTGNEVITGDLAVNGGDISTNSATFNLIETGATTVNAFGAATNVDIGATSGTITINNPTVVGTQTTQNLWNTTALTVNAFGAATAVTLGGTTGTMTLRNPTIVGASATQALFNTTATTVNAFGAATAVNVGATTGTATINNPTVVGSQATVNLWNTTSTAVNAFGAATALNIGNASNGQTVTIGGSSTAASTYNIGTGATANTITKTVNVGTGGVAGSTTNVNIGSASGGTTTINSATVTGNASSVNLWNTGATAVNAFGAATALNLGAANSTMTLNSSSIVGPALVNLWNTTSTTVNAFGAATALNLGAASGNTTINNNTVIAGDLEVSGGDFTTSAASFNLLNSPTTIVAFANASNISIGSAAGVTRVNDDLAVTGVVTVDGGAISATTSIANVFNTTSTTVNAFGAATALNIGAQSGLATIRTADVRLNGNTISTSNTTMNVFDTTATTVNAFGAATALNIGAATGTATIRNATVTMSGNTLATSSATINVFDTTATSANIVRAATTVNIGATTGTTSIRNTTVMLSGSTLSTASTTYNLLNTTATTINAFGAATAVNTGAAGSTFTFGKNTGDSSVVISGNTVSGTATLTSNVTTGKFAIAPSITSGSIDVGSSANTGKVSVLFSTPSSNTSTGALIVNGGVGIAEKLHVGSDTHVTGGLVVEGPVQFLSSDIIINADQSNTNDLTVYQTLTLDQTSGATVNSHVIPTSNTVFNLGNANSHWNNAYLKATITETVSAVSVSANTSTTRIARVGFDTTDAIEISTSGLGSNNRKVTITTPASPLTANATLTLANGNTTLQTGTMAIVGSGLNQFASTTSAQLAGVISDETGSGALVFGTAPTITSASLVTPTIGGAGATYSGSTSGSTVLKASAVAGTTTVTMPSANGTIALTSDINNTTITVQAGTGISGGGSFTTNQTGTTTLTITNSDRGSSQNIFKNIAVGANTITAGTNNSTLTIVGSGIISAVANATSSTVTLSAVESDTLATVTARGANTASIMRLTNATPSTYPDTGALIVTGGVGINDGLHVAGASQFYQTLTTSDVVISGNLTVNGTTTIINSSELTVDDKNIVLGGVTTPSDVTANGGGITLKGATDKSIVWDSANGNWTSSEHWNLASGKIFKIGNAGVLSASTLGSGVINSSLTSVGTITTGTWNATTIAVNRGGTGQTTYTDGQLLIGNSTGSTLTKATLTEGQNIAITNGAGSITIAAANTNIATSHSTLTVSITSSTGSSATINGATATTAGVVTTGAQTFAGAKTFDSVTATGDIAALNFNSTSDRNAKADIEVIDNAIDRITQIEGVTFRFANDESGKRHAGVIAQDVEKVLPEAVSEGTNGFKQVAYDNIIGLLIEAIKDQQKQIDELKALVSK